MPGPPPDSRAASLPSAQLKKHQFFGKRYFQGADGELLLPPAGLRRTTGVRSFHAMVT